jgi:Tfp pilus assembly protein PilP
MRVHVWMPGSSRTRDAMVEGKTVKVGDYVGFKSGYEQVGKITAISGDRLTLDVYDSNTGSSNKVVVSARDCWIN